MGLFSNKTPKTTQTPVPFLPSPLLPPSSALCRSAGQASLGGSHGSPRAPCSGQARPRAARQARQPPPHPSSAPGLPAAALSLGDAVPGRAAASRPQKPPPPPQGRAGPLPSPRGTSAAAPLPLSASRGAAEAERGPALAPRLMAAVAVPPSPRQREAGGTACALPWPGGRSGPGRTAPSLGVAMASPG